MATALPGLLGTAGALIAKAFGGAPIWRAVGFLVGYAIGSHFTEKDDESKPPPLDSAEGTTIPVVYGMYKVPCVPLWRSDFRESSKKKSKKGSEKKAMLLTGAPPEYECDAYFGVCEYREGQAICAIWLQKEEKDIEDILDEVVLFPGESTISKLAGNDTKELISFYVDSLWCGPAKALPPLYALVSSDRETLYEHGSWKYHSDESAPEGDRNSCYGLNGVHTVFSAGTCFNVTLETPIYGDQRSIDNNGDFFGREAIVGWNPQCFEPEHNYELFEVPALLKSSLTKNSKAREDFCKMLEGMSYEEARSASFYITRGHLDTIVNSYSHGCGSTAYIITNYTWPCAGMITEFFSYRDFVWYSLEKPVEDYRKFCGSTASDGVIMYDCRYKTQVLVDHHGTIDPTITKILGAGVASTAWDYTKLANLTAKHIYIHQSMSGSREVLPRAFYIGIMNPEFPNVALEEKPYPGLWPRDRSWGDFTREDIGFNDERWAVTPSEWFDFYVATCARSVWSQKVFLKRPAKSFQIKLWADLSAGYQIIVALTTSPFYFNPILADPYIAGVDLNRGILLACDLISGTCSPMSPIVRTLTIDPALSWSPDTEVKEFYLCIEFMPEIHVGEEDLSYTPFIQDHPLRENESPKAAVYRIDLTTHSHTSESLENPVEVVYDLLTNDKYGAGIPQENIDLESYHETREYVDELLASISSYEIPLTGPMYYGGSNKVYLSSLAAEPLLLLGKKGTLYLGEQAYHITDVEGPVTYLGGKDSNGVTFGSAPWLNGTYLVTTQENIFPDVYPEAATSGFNLGYYTENCWYFETGPFSAYKSAYQFIVKRMEGESAQEVEQREIITGSLCGRQATHYSCGPYLPYVTRTDLGFPDIKSLVAWDRPDITGETTVDEGLVRAVFSFRGPHAALPVSLPFVLKRSTLGIGILIDSTQEVSSWVETIMAHYQGYLAIRNNKIVFGALKPEQEVVRTITDQDIVDASAEPNLSVSYNNIETSANQVRLGFTLRLKDMTEEALRQARDLGDLRLSDFKTGTVIADDLADQDISKEVRLQSLSLMGIQDLCYAKWAAYRNLYGGLHRRVTISDIGLGLKHADLEAGDKIAITYSPLHLQDCPFLITSLKLDESGEMLRLSLLEDRPEFYITPVTPVLATELYLPPFTPPEPVLVAPVVYELPTSQSLNIAAAFSREVHTVEVFCSVDKVNWTNLGSLSSSAMGYVQEVLLRRPYEVSFMEREGSLLVSNSSAEPFRSSTQELEAEPLSIITGPFISSDHIFCSFKNAALTDENRWKLEEVLYYLKSSSPTDFNRVFQVLSVVNKDLIVSDVGLTVYFKFLPLFKSGDALSLDQVPTYSYTIKGTGYSLYPIERVFNKDTKDQTYSTSRFTVQWNQRSRFSGAGITRCGSTIIDSVDPNLSYYEVEVRGSVYSPSMSKQNVGENTECEISVSGPGTEILIRVNSVSTYGVKTLGKDVKFLRIA